MEQGHEQGHDLSSSSSSSGCAEQQLGARARSELFAPGRRRISAVTCAGKAPSGSEEPRGEVFRAAPRREQGQRLLPAELGRSRWVAGAAGRDQLPPPRHLVSLLPAHGPGRSRGAAKGTRVTAGAAAAAPCRGAQGSTCPPGSPGPRCGNQVRAGPRDPRSSCAPSCGTGCFTPGIALHCVHRRLGTRF